MNGSNSTSCVVSELISYIERQHKMRDAQIESIKTYLFLKIECENLLYGNYLHPVNSILLMLMTLK